MNEIMETIYQWHEGRKIKQISVSLGIDRVGNGVASLSLNI